MSNERGGENAGKESIEKKPNIPLRVTEDNAKRELTLDERGDASH